MFANCTKHDIVVRSADDTTITFVATGVVPRVAMKTVDLLPLDGVPLGAVEYGAVIEMPAPVVGIHYIVSAMVADRLSGRNDIYVPDSGPTAIRENGQVVAVRRLIRR